MRYGYNTNGFSFHRLEDAIVVLAELGYRAIALTLDVHHLDPARSTRAEIEVVHRLLRTHDLTIAIETGARFVLDPRRKHWPTLLDADPHLSRCRETYLMDCLAVGEHLGAQVLSFWSGAIPRDVTDDQAMERLVGACTRIVHAASARGIDACLEPEPGMFIESMDDFDALRSQVPGLKLALDVGHVFATENVSPQQVLRRHRDHLGQITLDDARAGVHEHLVPGEGVGDWPAILATIAEIDHDRPLYVELGRHAHDAVNTARRTLAFLYDREPAH
ncbi:MAG: sugar phosphate isomerase/epimerase [Planctomycetes bacterium]|nr:sugar phosphate isomerase/epimerase [Planctomycetota bacterium]